jgi:hypothetical protein
MPINTEAVICQTRPAFSLPDLHQRTIALQLSVAGRDCLLVGRGVYEQAGELGRILRIEWAASDGLEIMICEATWNGEIQTGESHGCDFQIQLS